MTDTRDNQLDDDPATLPSHHRTCPDDGTCHHTCPPRLCYRVRTCEPLTGAMPDDTWPADIRAGFGQQPRPRVRILLELDGDTLAQAFPGPLSKAAEKIHDMVRVHIARAAGGWTPSTVTFADQGRLQYIHARGGVITSPSDCPNQIIALSAHPDAMRDQALVNVGRAAVEQLQFAGPVVVTTIAELDPDRSPLLSWTERIARAAARAWLAAVG